MEGGFRSHVVIEAMVRERMLAVEIFDGTREPTESILEYRINQANGQPLPGWLERVGNGRLIGVRPANVEHVDLKVTIIYTDGSFEEIAVEIDTATGHIKPLELQRDARAVRPFSEQFALREFATEDDIADLAQMLRAEGPATLKNANGGASVPSDR